MSIIYGDDFNAYDYVPESSLVSMFANNSGLESIVNPETFLPYTNVSDSCYVSLFEGCTSLTNSPTLPATTLTYDCYAMMFRGCSNLKHIKMLAKEAKKHEGFLLESRIVCTIGSAVYLQVPSSNPRMPLGIQPLVHWVIAVFLPVGRL